MLTPTNLADVASGGYEMVGTFNGGGGRWYTHVKAGSDTACHAAGSSRQAWACPRSRRLAPAAR